VAGFRTLVPSSGMQIPTAVEQTRPEDVNRGQK
jgi:hypothetical protein